MLSTYRVNHYVGTTPKTSFVVASSEAEASSFLGVRDGSAQVSTVASPVEVVGLDKPHAALATIPVNVAPFDIPHNVSRKEFEGLQQQITDLKALIAETAKA